MQKQNFFFALVRISLGWIFLWAFLDKLFGLGFATAKEAAWISGGSPTTGFLTHAVSGPFADFFSSLAGAPWVDWLFMIGLLCLGVALILGIAMRLAGFFGALLMVIFYLASAIPPTNNPFVDEHIVYALMLLGFAVSEEGQTLGLGKQWRGSALVKKLPFLK